MAERRGFVGVVSKAQMASSCEVCWLDEHVDRWVGGVGALRLG